MYKTTPKNKWKPNVSSMLRKMEELVPIPMGGLPRAPGCPTVNFGPLSNSPIVKKIWKEISL